MTRYYAYSVRWRDSGSLPHWRAPAELDNQPVIIESVGYMVASDKQAITITTSVSGFNHAVDPLTIPREAIVRLRRLDLRATIK